MIEAFTVFVSSDLKKVSVELNGDVFSTLPDDVIGSVVQNLCGVVIDQIESTPVDRSELD